MSALSLRGILLAWLMAIASVQAVRVVERPAEFITAADFDGDGYGDVAIVDRASGAVRIAYTDKNGQVLGALSAYSGIDGVEGVSVGRLLATNRSTLAITGPYAGRVSLVEATNRLVAAPPVPVYPYASISLNQVLALDIEGFANNPSLDDLFSTTRFYDPSFPYLYDVSRNYGATFSNLMTGALAAEHAAGNVFRMAPAGRRLGGFIRRGASDEFVAYNFTNEIPAEALTISGLASGSVFAAHYFTSTGLAHIVTWQPGGTALVFHAVTQTGPGAFTSHVERVEHFSSITIGSVAPVPGTNQLVIVNDPGTVAGMFNYVPGAGLSGLYGLASGGAGGPGIAAVTAIGNRLAVLWGEETSGHSSSLELYAFDGARYSSLGDPFLLPAVKPSAGRANVWAFKGDPFADASAELLTTLQAADWSTSFGTSGIPASIVVTSEVDAGAISGLQSPISRQVGSMPAAADNGMVNQLSDAVSVLSVEPAAGPVLGTFTVDPPAGAYPNAVEISINTSTSLVVAVYRRGLENSWETYSGPFWIYEDVTLYVVGLDADNLTTPVSAIEYTFANDPVDQDCDGDRVPDFVEIEYGLDPCAGGDDSDEDGLTDLDELLAGTNPALADSDGDGWTDMQELRAGTDPSDLGDAPASQDDVDNGAYNRIDRAVVFDLNITPRPYFQSSGAGFNGYARTGTQHRVYGLDGSLYGFSAARNASVPGVTNPHAAFIDLPLGAAPGLVVYASDSAFPLTVTTNLRGREIISLVNEPEVSLPETGYVSSGADRATEASNWVAAAQAEWGSVTRPVVNTFAAAVEHTLAACLFERGIEQIMAERGVYTNGVNLFPWRGPYGTAETPTAEDVAGLEAAVNGWPAHDLGAFSYALQDAIMTPYTPSATNLRQLARAMYRVSSTNDGPFSLPFDAMRTFAREGYLVPSYSNTLNVSPGVLASAYSEVTNLLALLQPREQFYLELEARSEIQPGDCITLYDTSTGDPYALVRADGSPYDLTKTFNIISGTVFHVNAMDALTSTPCPGDALEIVDIFLAAFVFATEGDVDGNLMPDEWELIALGGSGGSFTNDSDGDGFSDLQEYLDGTDPADPGSRSLAAADLSNPGVMIDISGTNVIVSWDWPIEYADRFNFTLQRAESLSTNFTDDVTVSGQISAVSALDTKVSTNAFHRLGISLRE